jgi:hypothetical protein
MKPTVLPPSGRKLRALIVMFLAVMVVDARALEERRYQWHIERQSLGEALREVGRQTGLQVAGFSEAMDGVAPVGPVDGVLSLQQVLLVLLTPRGLTYRIINEHMIAIVPAIHAPDQQPRRQRRASQSPSVPDHGGR